MQAERAWEHRPTYCKETDVERWCKDACVCVCVCVCVCACVCHHKFVWLGLFLCTLMQYMGFMGIFLCLVGCFSMIIWTPAVLSVL